MGFFQSLYHSLYDVAWLASVRNDSRRAWKFFLTLSLCGAFIATVLGFLLALSAFRVFERSYLSNIPDFKAEVKNGVLHVEGDIIQPLVQRTAEGPFLFVLDTVSSNTPTIESLVHNPEGEIVLISRERLEYFSQQRNERTNFDIKELQDGTLSKTDIVDTVKKIGSWQGLIAIFIVAFMIVLFTLVFGHLFSVLIVAFIAYIIARILKRPWHYKELYTAGLFVPIVPCFITVSLTLVGIEISRLYSVSLLAFLLSVIVTAKPLPPESPVATENVSPKPQI